VKIIGYLHIYFVCAKLFAMEITLFYWRLELCHSTGVISFSYKWLPNVCVTSQADWLLKLLLPEPKNAFSARSSAAKQVMVHAGLGGDLSSIIGNI
jgi:hypothetical protein